MKPKTVDKLEKNIEDAIAEVITKLGQKKLPLLPSQRTMHLTAKAAVAVYEAAVENDARPGGMTMAYDESLAQRIRGTLARKKGIEEKKMFGGVCFLLKANILPTYPTLTELVPVRSLKPTLGDTIKVRI
jgi:hypothetical protein